MANEIDSFEANSIYDPFFQEQAPGPIPQEQIVIPEEQIPELQSPPDDQEFHQFYTPLEDILDEAEDNGFTQQSDDGASKLDFSKILDLPSEAYIIVGICLAVISLLGSFLIYYGFKHYTLMIKKHKKSAKGYVKGKKISGPIVHLGPDLEDQKFETKDEDELMFGTNEFKPNHHHRHHHTFFRKAEEDYDEELDYRVPSLPHNTPEDEDKQMSDALDVQIKSGTASLTQNNSEALGGFSCMKEPETTAFMTNYSGQTSSEMFNTMTPYSKSGSVMSRVNTFKRLSGTNSSKLNSSSINNKLLAPLWSKSGKPSPIKIVEGTNLSPIKMGGTNEKDYDGSVSANGVIDEYMHKDPNLGASSLKNSPRKYTLEQLIKLKPSALLSCMGDLQAGEMCPTKYMPFKFPDFQGSNGNGEKLEKIEDELTTIRLSLLNSAPDNVSKCIEIMRFVAISSETMNFRNMKIFYLSYGLLVEQIIDANLCVELYSSLSSILSCALYETLITYCINCWNFEFLKANSSLAKLLQNSHITPYVSRKPILYKYILNLLATGNQTAKLVEVLLYFSNPPSPHNLFVILASAEEASLHNPEVVGVIQCLRRQITKEHQKCCLGVQSDESDGDDGGGPLNGGSFFNYNSNYYYDKSGVQMVKGGLSGKSKCSLPGSFLSSGYKNHGDRS
ncbi:unnamed protein product [Ambrosiozyma monospora]|uniref:Unnamed protein product n=1 Tax=Ambrosiozyma monospora TaxID=43982 RepID=A0A9W7DI87_AMBMO|nr:unnamed protein product [Ambrosiozyma monospora]